MFSLDNTMRYWLYNKPVNMRMGFNGLSGIVNNSMGMSMRSGDVFVFVNAARNSCCLLSSFVANVFACHEPHVVSFSRTICESIRKNLLSSHKPYNYQI